MKEVVRIADDFLCEIEEILLLGGVLSDPQSFGYKSVDEPLKDMGDPEIISFMLRVYKEEITSLLLSGKVEKAWMEDCIKIISMIEELEFYVETGNRAEFFFRAYEVHFFLQSFLSRIS